MTAATNETSSVQAHSRVAVILLNWRAPEMTLQAIERIFDQTATPNRVFVVENGSNDDSGVILSEGLRSHDDRVTLLINDRNLGFGAGCNTALREILAQNFDWVWLLNNDAEPASDCLAALLAATAAEEGRLGLVGTLMVDPSAPDRSHFGSWMHPVSLTSHSICGDGDFVRHAFSWMTAASLLVSTDALRTVGLFDEQFFMYWEDADLNMRIRDAGYRIVAAPDAMTHHVAGTSSKGMETQRYLWHFASQSLFLQKYHPTPVTAKACLRVKYLLRAALNLDAKRFRALLRT